MAIGAAIQIGLMAYGAYKNFEQANQASSLRKQAERDAERAMANAKKLVKKNAFEGMAIAKEAYIRQQEAANVSAAQAIEALRESDRGAGRIGGVYSQKQAIDANIASQMAGDIYDLDLLKARSKEQEYDALAGIELQEKAGQELYMSDLDRQIKEGVEGGLSTAGSAVALGMDQSDGQLSKKIKANIADRRAGREAAQLAAMGVTNTGQSSIMQTSPIAPIVPSTTQFNPYDPIFSFTQGADFGQGNELQLMPNIMTPKYSSTPSLYPNILDYPRGRSNTGF
jgi:hypothetical protein